MLFSRKRKKLFIYFARNSRIKIMSEKIAVINQKGGVGKTTTAYNLASTLARYNKRVLLLDLDPQGNCSSALGIDSTYLKKTISNVLLGEIEIKKAIKKSNVHNVFIVPSNLTLAMVETDLISLNKVASTSNLNEILKEKTLAIYDYIIMDCPPSLGYLSMNALNASSSLIIPVQCEYFAVDAIAQLLATINQVQRSSNPNLEIMGFLITMHDTRLKFNTEIATSLRQEFKDKVFTTIIPRNVSIPIATSNALPVNLYKPASIGSLRYLALAREVMEYVERKKEI